MFCSALFCELYLLSTLVANRPVDRAAVDARLVRLRLCPRREVGLETVVVHCPASDGFEPAAM